MSDQFFPSFISRSYILSFRSISAEATGNSTFQVMETLSCGISHPAPCRGWSTTSLLTARQAGLSRLNPFAPSSSPLDPLWHPRVCALDILRPNTSHIHTASQSSAPASQASAVCSGWQTCLQHHYAAHYTAGFHGTSTLSCDTEVWLNFFTRERQWYQHLKLCKPYPERYLQK